ncbi:MAG: TIGR03663 family protein [Kiritimatiellaeota bacterium]|nr:TIGR03663 family protein [Kiritimatiellota bacterium]
MNARPESLKHFPRNGSAAWALERWIPWLILLAVAFVSRFYGLGERALSHDESMHAWYSWAFATSGRYAHHPMTHGPLLFHLNALVFRLLGASDTTARLMPALAGVGVVAGLLFFQRWLGRTAAFLAAALAVLSPTLLFYSRYIRNDLYMALFALIWVYGLLRYIETPRRAWLALVALGMALSFACKETVFITGLIFGGWLVALTLVRALAPPGRPPPNNASESVSAVEHAPFSVGPAADLAVFMLCTALPFAAALGLQACGWDPCDWLTPLGQYRALGMQAALALAGLAGAAGWLRFRQRGAPRETRPPARWWLICAAGFWLLQVILYTSVFTNLGVGAVSGVSGGLGYWLAQHGVQRAGQPWFYYLMLAALYEFLPLLLAAGAVVRFFIRRREQPPLLVSFCAVWALAAFAAYSLAGEKMPWLLVHITLPLILLGAVWAGGFIERCAKDFVPRGPALAWMACAPLIFYALINLPATVPFTGRTLADAHARLQALRVLAAGLLLGWLVWRSTPRLTAAVQRRGLIAGSLALLVFLTARTAFQLAFVNYDLPIEPLVYAHGTPDLTRTARRAERLQRLCAGRDTPVVAYDDQSTWPFIWYFRQMRACAFGNRVSSEILSAPLILCGDAQLAAVRALTGTNYVEEAINALWWPQDGYKHGLLNNAGRLVREREQRRWLWRVVAFREYPGSPLATWPKRRSAYLFIRREWAARADPDED